MVYFQTINSQFGEILEGLGLENVDIFYGHLEYFMAIWIILRQVGIFFGNLGFFF
jgi:hypothetical protein